MHLLIQYVSIASAETFIVHSETFLPSQDE